MTDARRYDRFWMVADRTGAEVCTDLPGLTEDGIVTTGTGPLIRWYSGELTIDAARASGVMAVAAPPWLERELGRWGRLNPYAGVGPARLDPTDLPPESSPALAAAGPARRAATAHRPLPVA